MPLFGKKKKGSGDDELEVMDKTENDKSEINVNKKSPLAHLKKKARFMFKLRLKRKDGEEADAMGIDDIGDSTEKKKKPKKEKKEKPPKEKKEKAPKEKKEKKPKEPKAKKNAKAEASEGGEEENNDGGAIKPIVWIIVAASAVIIGVIAFFIFNSTLNQPSVEERLIEANELLVAEKYSKAFKIYEKLLKEDETLVPAYIGWAEALHKNNQTDYALAKLNTALPLTNNDPRILAKIDEIENPPPEPEPSETEEPDAESSGDEESSAEAVEGEETAEGDDAAESASVATAATTAPIAFTDPAFESMVRIALKKTEGEAVTSSDLSSITSLKILGGSHAVVSGGADPDANNTLTSLNRLDSYTVRGEVYTERGTIRNLNDLKHFTSLKKLVVAYNSITDISGIAELKSLNTVGLYCNEITDITPLAKLEALEYLYIYNNHISDISPLASLTKMRQLWLNNNNISDISALKGFDVLQELFLSYNIVRDIAAVSGMKSLTTLYFDNNQVTDISAVKDLEALGEISFLNNPVKDTAPASQIRRVNQPYY